MNCVTCARFRLTPDCSRALPALQRRPLPGRRRRDRVLSRPGGFDLSTPKPDTTKTPGASGDARAPTEGRLMNETPAPTTGADAPVVTEDPQAEDGCAIAHDRAPDPTQVAATGNGGRTPST